MKEIKVFESFSGYGSQSMSLRDLNIPHKVVGISEIDVDAIIAYGAVRYNLDELKTDKTHEEMKKELMDKNVGYDFKKGKSKIPRMKKDKLEMLYKFDKASNNFGDVSIINPNNLPDFDYFTMSFPCQDISLSGNQKGIKKGKTRSGLLYECEKIIETKKPKYVLMENVKNLVGKKFRGDFDNWCKYLEGLGYKNYHNNYKCLNAKDFGVAQNRERIFMISILGEHDEYTFPDGKKLTKKLKDFLEEEVDEKYYLSESIQNRFKQTKVDNGDSNIIGTTAPEERNIGQRDRVYGMNSICPSLTSTDYKQPKQILETIHINDKETFNYCPTGENVIGQMSGELWEKRHEQARRVYNTEKVSPTIPTCTGGGVHPKILEHNTVCEQRADEGLRFFKDNICGTIRTINSGGDKRIIEVKPYFRIRKLTPRECLRLMGVSDEDISKMQSVGLSDTSLYKLAGNSIVKQCLDALHRSLFIKE